MLHLWYTARIKAKSPDRPTPTVVPLRNRTKTYYLHVVGIPTSTCRNSYLYSCILGSGAHADSPSLALSTQSGYTVSIMIHVDTCTCTVVQIVDDILTVTRVGGPCIT